MKLKIVDIPSWQAEKVSLLFSKNNISVNNYNVFVGDIPEPEYTEQYLRIVDWEITLRELDYENKGVTSFDVSGTDSLLSTNEGFIKID